MLTASPLPCLQFRRKNSNGVFNYLLANWLDKRKSKSATPVEAAAVAATLEGEGGETRSIGIETPAALRIFNIADTGVNVNETTALGISALFRAIAIRAGLMATMPRKLYRRRPGDDREEATTHPLFTLLELMPEDEYTPFDFWHSMEANAILKGGAGAEIIRDASGRPRSLRLMRYGATAYKPFKNEPLRIYDNEDGRLFYPQDVLYIPGLMVTDGNCAKSLVTWFKDSFGEQLAARMMASAYFKQGPFLGGVYTYTGSKIKKEGRSAEAHDLATYFGGFEKAGLVLPIADGDKFTQLQPPNFAQTQMVELRKFGIEEVARMTGVPVSLLMELDKPSYNSLTQLFLQFKITTLDPRATQYDQECNRKLLAERDFSRYYIETDIDELMWASPDERVRYWSELFKMSAITPNEIRKYLNKNKVEGGDEVFVFTNNVLPMSQVIAQGEQTEDETEIEPAAAGAGASR